MTINDDKKRIVKDTDFDHLNLLHAYFYSFEQQTFQKDFHFKEEKCGNFILKIKYSIKTASSYIVL